MRLMCSQNQDEVEVVKNELLKAGIITQIRSEPAAEAMGVPAVALFVPDSRNFFNASRIYARMKEEATGSSEQSTQPQTGASDPSVGTAKPNADQHNSSHRNGSSVDSTHPRREEWKQATLLLEKGMAEIFRLEGESAAECASLRNKAEELSQALAQGQATLAREIEGRVAAEKSHASKISALSDTLDRERQKWQQQLKDRDDSLKGSQEKLESMSRALHAREASATAFKEQIVALELQLEEHKGLVRNARTEALAEREARIAAEERAQKLDAAQAALEQERLKHKELEQQMQAHVASLTSLFQKPDSKRASRG